MNKASNERSSMNRKFRNRLGDLLKETRISQAALARSVGVSPAVISKYLSDPKKEPLFHIVSKIAQHFDVSVEWLGGMSDERAPFQTGSINDLYFRLSATGKSELFSYGQFLLAKEQQLGEEGAAYQISPPVEVVAETPPASYYPRVDSVTMKIIPKVADFAFSVAGEAMEPLVHAGAVEFAKDQSRAEDGDIVLAEVDGTVTCRKYFSQEGRVELQPLNPSYEPITDFKAMRIIGKVII